MPPAQASTTIAELLERACLARPDALAWIAGSRRVRFNEYRDRSSRLTTGLAKSGIGPGDRVAFLLHNCIEIAELVYATARLGAILVPLNFRHTPVEHQRVLEDATPAAIVTEPEFLLGVEPVFGQIPSLKLFVATEPQPGWTVYQRLLDNEPAPFVQVPDSAPAWLVYTSGTTGTPKGVTLTHANLTTMSRIVSASRGVGPGVRFLLSMPQCHIGGAAVTLMVPAAGATAIVLPRFRPEAALDAIEAERINHATFAPTMLISLIRSGMLQGRDISSLELISYASAPMPRPWLELALRTFQCRFWQGYGLTESCGYVTALDAEDHRLDGGPAGLDRLASAGRPMAGVEVRIVDVEDRDVPDGAVGELITRNPMVMQGYWQRPEETAATLRNGWLHTGDLARQDADGYITIVDRKKDVIISGGLTIASIEVEQALLTHPDLLEAAVIGVPDDYWGEAVKAFVVPRPGARPTDHELIAWCRELIAGYKKPQSIELRESLPKTATGKVRKDLLRAECLGYRLANTWADAGLRDQ